MNRRQFLAASAASAASAAGCKRKPAPATAPDADAARIAADRAARDRHLVMLEECRIPSHSVRSTWRPPVDILAAFPELRGLTKVTVRLHPRFGDEPKLDGSKLGGRFLWPVDEPWPETDGVPFAAVLQLRADDAPPTVRFRPGADLMQLLWLPRDPVDGRVSLALKWRARSAVGTPLVGTPATERALLRYVPVPCRVFPERVTELPDADSLAKTDLAARLETWTPPAKANLSGREYYARRLSAAPGTKVGGYPRSGTGASCPACKWGMDYLLTIDSAEWEPADATRWRPVEEADDVEGCRRAAGFTFPGAVRVFVCRRCESWPAAAVV